MVSQPQQLPAPQLTVFISIPDMNEALSIIANFPQIHVTLQSQPPIDGNPKCALFCLSHKKKNGLMIRAYTHEEAMDKLNVIKERQYISDEKYTLFCGYIKSMNLAKSQLAEDLEEATKMLNNVASAINRTFTRLNLAERAYAINCSSVPEAA